jgi:hypothetical protein
MPQEKNKWVRPKLIVLVRGDMQERVLGVCKGAFVGGPWGAINNCVVGPNGELMGVACIGFVPS